jgi:integrase
MRTFGIVANPIADIGALAQFNRVRDRHLSPLELGAFLKRLDALRPGVQKDALQLCLLLGGQRPSQLLRCRAAEIDLAAGTIALHDPKGARQQPRLHVLPLTKDATAILERRVQGLIEGEPLFSTDRKTAMRIETLGGVVSRIAEEMVKEQEAREPFQLRDLRRTCETMLAALGVSSDIRAQLQSHGLGGVQARHYDRHSYALEKRRALEKWARHLARLKAGETAKVVRLKPRRRARGA